MKTKSFRGAAFIALLLLCAMPLFSQPKMLDAGSKIEYAVDWHLNGGTQNKANTSTYTAEDGFVLAAPTRPGYTFDGWYENASLTGEKVTEIKKGETQKKAFYAKWVISRDLAIEYMKGEMVTVIPKGKKTSLDDFAGAEGTTVINAYEIARHEVTQDLYAAVMGENPSKFCNNPADGEVQEKRPVENVSWYDAIVFCNKLSEICGLTPCYSVNGNSDVTKWNYKPHNWDIIFGNIECNYSANGYRLPSEAEWEMAARGGFEGGWNYKYSGSDRIDDVAWYWDNSYNRNAYERTTHEVGKKKANSLGLYDMSGNVGEWCDNLYSASSGSNRIRRGGWWYYSAGYCKVAYRGSNDPSGRYGDDILGFRLVRSAQ